MSVAWLDPDGVSVTRAAGAVVVGLLLALLGVSMREPVTPTLAVIYLLVLAYFIANAFDEVRDHPAYHLASAAWGTVISVLLYLGPGDGSRLFLVLIALVGVAVLVEAYNYWRGTSHLRLE